MSQQSEHLSRAQIEEYGIHTSGAGPEEEDRMEKHLKECPSCRGRVLEFRREEMGFIKPKAVRSHPAEPLPGNGTESVAPAHSHGEPVRNSRTRKAKIRPTPDCPSEEELCNLAASLCPGPVGSKLVQHAATCDYCGPVLQAYTKDFQDDFSDEERAELEKLSSASLQWQLKVARKMLNPGRKWKFLPGGRWKLVPAFALLLLLVGSAVWIYPLLMLRPARLSMEVEYRKGRPMEYRVAGVPYGPYTPQRGGPGDPITVIHVPYPGRAPLLAANVALLQGKSEAAEGILQAYVFHFSGHSGDKLLSGSDVPLPVLNNLVVAYAMEAENASHDYRKALEATDLVLRINNADPVALFNRALILERRGGKDDQAEAIRILETLKNRTGLEPEWRKEAADKLRLLQLLQ